MRYRIVVFAASLLLSVSMAGCLNLTTKIQSDDLTVKNDLYGTDCVPLVFGLGWGTVDIERAKQDGRTRFMDWDERQLHRGATPISKVRSVEITHQQYLNIFGLHCIEVHGEPKDEVHIARPATEERL